MLALSFALLSGCALLPEVRVFQKKVPTDAPTEQVTEAQRLGAKYIEQKSASPGTDPVQTVHDIHSAAVPLSASLGEPKKPTQDLDKVVIELNKANLASQKKADDWKKFAQKYAGKEIEGTGVDLAAPGAFFGLATVVAIFVFVPGSLTVALFAIRRAKSALAQVAQSVEEFSAKNPTAGGDLKARFSVNLDRAEKALVSEAKRFVDPKKVEEHKNETA